jgi:predicted metal-binding membrane protein
MLTTELSGRSLALQERIILLLTVILVSLFLWGALLSGHPLMHSMGRSGLFLPLLSNFLMWLLMMTAMMLPPVLPWIWFFAAATKETPGEGVSWLRTALFSSGYFTLWGLFSLLAAGLQIILHHWGSYGPSGLVMAPAISGFIIMTAGLFQFSSLKSACLQHCRSPLGYFLLRWKSGPVGAFKLGFGHGLFCLGCCWALMCLAFALGTMNLLWMGLIVLLLCAEKIAPHGQLISKFSGAGFTLWGSYLLWAALK